MKRIINLTPHPVNYIPSEDGAPVREFPSSGVLRVGVSRELSGYACGVPVYRSEFGREFSLNGSSLSEPELVKFIKKAYGDEVCVLVSLPVLQALSRTVWDGIIFVAPDTSPASAVRDSNGRIVGVRAFMTL